jgi:hypothetical protein
MKIGGPAAVIAVKFGHAAQKAPAVGTAGFDEKSDVAHIFQKLAIKSVNSFTP